MASDTSGLKAEEFDDGIDFNEIGGAVLRQAWKILAFAVFTTIVALYLVLKSTPVFTSTGSLYLGDAQSGPNNTQQNPSNSLNFISNFSSVSDIQTQVELIKGHALIEQSILETGLNSPVMPQDKEGFHFWKWKLFYHGAISAYAPAPCDVQALYASFAEPLKGTATFKLRFEDGGNYRITQGGGWFSKPAVILDGVIGKPAAGGGLSLEIKPVIADGIPQSGSTYILKVSSAQALADSFIKNNTFSVMTTGTVVQPTKVANLKFIWSNPYEGTKFVNQVMQNFIATQISWQTASASTTEQFVKQQLDSISSALAEADKSLAAYQANSGVLDVTENAKSVISELSQYQVQRTTLQVQQEALLQLSEEIANPNKQLNPYLVSQVNDIVLSNLSNILSSAQVQLEALRVQYTADATEVKIQEATVKRIQDAIKATVNNELATETKSLATLDGLIGKFQDQMNKMPAESLKVITLQRSTDVLGTLYVSLMEEEEQAKVSKAATIINTRIVTPSEVPLTATKPTASETVIVGMLLGVFGGIALVLAARTLSSRFQSVDDIRKQVHLPVLGLIPAVRQRDLKAGIFPANTQSPFAEAFRTLRSNLYLSGAAKKPRIILIASATALDQKAIIAANLAKALADDNKRVLFLDANLRSGLDYEVLKIGQAPGLSEWLQTGQNAGYKAISNERFRALPSGVLPPNPTELLNDSRLEQIMLKLREEFDFIIVDSPPLPQVSDVMTLGSFADLILSVVNIAHTPRRLFSEHVQAIAKLGRQHGLIINSVPNSRGLYGGQDGTTGENPTRLAIRQISRSLTQFRT